MSEPILGEGEVQEAAELSLLLESLAQEATDIANKAETREMLERRLGPLLKAGREMRDSIGGCAVRLDSFLDPSNPLPLDQQKEIIQPATDRCVAALSAWNVARRDALERRAGQEDKL
jgi:hypothetical protein